MFKKSIALLVIVAMTLIMVGCATHLHQIGKGAQGSNRQSVGQWYILWGLVPLNDVNTHAMAGDVENYTIKTQLTFVDALIGCVTGVVTINKRTVTVTK